MEMEEMKKRYGKLVGWMKTHSQKDPSALEIAEDSGEGKTRTKKSFALNSTSEFMFKITSTEYGITQGEMMDVAPFLFNRIAEKSLERRKESLNSLFSRAAEISKILDTMKSFAPHLEYALDQVNNFLDDVLEAEQQSIDSRNIKGLNKIDWTPFGDLMHPHEPELYDDAIALDLREFLGKLNLHEIMTDLIPDEYTWPKDDSKERKKDKK